VPSQFINLQNQKELGERSRGKRAQRRTKNQQENKRKDVSKIAFPKEGWWKWDKIPE